MHIWGTIDQILVPKLKNACERGAECHAPCVNTHRHTPVQNYVIIPCCVQACVCVCVRVCTSVSCGSLSSLVQHVLQPLALHNGCVTQTPLLMLLLFRNVESHIALRDDRLKKKMCVNCLLESSVILIHTEMWCQNVEHYARAFCFWMVVTTDISNVVDVDTAADLGGWVG